MAAELPGLADGLRDLAVGALHWAQAAASGIAIFRSVARDLLAALPSRWLLAAAMALVSSLMLLLASGTLVYRVSTRGPEAAPIRKHA